MLRHLTHTHERWLTATALTLLAAFLATMHGFGVAARSDLCTALTGQDVLSDTLCAARCGVAAIVALGLAVALWLRAAPD